MLLSPSAFPSSLQSSIGPVTFIICYDFSILFSCSAAVCRPDLLSPLSSPSSVFPAFLQDFHGHDAVGLFQNGILVDSIGSPTSANGNVWVIDGVQDAMYNHTLRRKPFVYRPSANFLDQTLGSVGGGDTGEFSVQWDVMRVTYSGLGVHNVSYACPSGKCADQGAKQNKEGSQLEQQGAFSSSAVFCGLFFYVLSVCLVSYSTALIELSCGTLGVSSSSSSLFSSQTSFQVECPSNCHFYHALVHATANPTLFSSLAPICSAVCFIRPSIHPFIRLFTSIHHALLFSTANQIFFFFGFSQTHCCLGLT